MRQVAEHTFEHHSDKVQAVAWNPVETPVLLTGGFDKLAALVSLQAGPSWERPEGGLGSSGERFRETLAVQRCVIPILLLVMTSVGRAHFHFHLVKVSEDARNLPPSWNATALNGTQQGWGYQEKQMEVISNGVRQ